MTILSTFGGASSGVDTGDIGHSLRCRSAASAYLSRTFGTPTSTTIWTWSGWIKRGALTGTYRLFGASTNTYLTFNSSDQLNLTLSGVSACTSTAVFRDPTSPIHVVYQQNGSAQTIWVNNVSVATGTTAASIFNTAVAHQIGAANTSNYFDGYLSRVCFVDGQALTPSSFAYLNTEINEWVSKTQAQVKAVVDAGGANSFMLDFDDATSLTTLGYDKSSKGNNWTLNNFTLTAGTTYDHMLDVPGNSFCVGNPLNTMLASAYAEGNLKIGTASAGLAYLHACTQAMTTGKWYFEATLTGYVVGSGAIGIFKSTASLDAASPGGYANTNWYGYANNGQKFNGASQVAYGATYNATTPDVVACAYDADAGSVEFFKNGVSQGVAFTGVTGGAYPAFMAYNGNYFVLCTGQAPLHASATYHSAAGGYFRYTPPTGFKALCQRNLPDPAILNPSSAVAHRFEAGSGIASAIATDRSGWSDWMEWFKRTDTTESWKVRFSDDSSNMMAFDTNGAKAAWSAPSTGTYLGAAFKLGASSGCVSGTYSGDSTSNKNISHSLGKVPTAALVKNESTGSWYVWHTKMTSAAYFTTLNSATPPAQSNTNTPWGTGNWSSTQFMVTNNATNNLNATGSTYRYILFADIDGLLALLGHTGNASTDGAFEYAGHKAQLLIEKDLSATTGFYVWSDKIDTYNVTASYLLLNTNAGTAAATGVDICSNAVKYRSATIANAANPHMGISYSRTPGKYSLGR